MRKAIEIEIIVAVAFVAMWLVMVSDINQIHGQSCINLIERGLSVAEGF